MQAEPVRLRGHLSLSFPPRDVMAMQLGEGEGARPSLDVAFLTLYGVDSPLPLHVTEALLREEEPEARQRVRDFLDIFNHRLLSLLYRVWSRYRLPVVVRQWGDDNLSRALAELLDLPTFPADVGMPLATVLPIAGLFFVRPRSARGLEQVLALLFPDLHPKVLSCVPREVRLERADLCALGRRRCRLGRDLVLGDTVWDATSKLRIQVGPVTDEQVGALRPPGEAFRRIAALVALWCQDALCWDLEIRLASTSREGTRLGGDAPPVHLGVNTWLGAPPARAASIVVQPSEGAQDA